MAKDVYQRMHDLKVRGYRFLRHIDFVRHVAEYENMYTGYRLIVHMDTGYTEKIHGEIYE